MKLAIFVFSCGECIFYFTGVVLNDECGGGAGLNVIIPDEWCDVIM